MSPSCVDAGPPPAVHSIDEFVFSVPDLAVARQFYESFGLDVRDVDGALALHTHGHPHRWARVLQAAGPKRLRWLSFGIHDEDLARFAAQAAVQAVRIDRPPAGADADGIWLAGPDGLPVQLRVADKCSPDSPAPQPWPEPQVLRGRAPARRVAPRIRPLYLSHLLLFTADVDRARVFYEGVLGLRLSDSAGSAIAFLHTPHGSDHHLLALARSDGGGLHHSSWCVPSIDAVGQGARQMAEAGHAQGWGLGRHVLGSNYFRYVRDPWGSYAEYSCDIDHVPAGQTWPAADHPAEDALYVWGPELPADFIVNHETTGR
ncbi:MAG: hypothetical protein RL223_3863 [Pseudomonadota bacterium]|jgi:catechol-2,3-dioxygenase